MGEGEGYKKVEKILEKLDYTDVRDIFPRKPNTKFPYDMVAVKGNERFLIEVKYVKEAATGTKREGKSTGGFPFPWICRAWRVLTHMNAISESWKPLLFVMAERSDRMSYLIMEPRFEKPCFECDFKEGEDYESVEGMIPPWLKRYPSK